MRDRLIFTANLIVVIFLAFIAVEMTLRVYLFGLPGLSPTKVNSFKHIFRSELIQPADNLDVWYELKPDQRTLFRGAPFHTNSHGLADDEYSYEKPANTYRVAVIGSSWTMPAGVSIENSFHSLLENDFNQQSASTKYEFLNFGVENYGLGEMMGTIHHKAMRYDPDMILFIMTGYTPAIRWEPHEEPFVIPAPKNSDWTSYAALQLSGLLGINMEQPSNISNLRDTVKRKEWGGYFRQVERAFDELAALSKTSGIPVAAAWLRINKINTTSTENLGKLFVQRASEKNITGMVVDLEHHLNPGEPLLKLLVNRVEKHPNNFGHEIIAAQIYEKIFFNSLPVIPPP
jgi:hypothetical protein